MRIFVCTLTLGRYGYEKQIELIFLFFVVKGKHNRKEAWKKDL